MKVVIAMDSFKGSLTTAQAGNAVARAADAVWGSDTAKVFPLADGGEGTVDALVSAMGGEMRTATVKNPLGKPIQASYGILARTGTAVIEMASAAGLTLIDACDRNPQNTTTYGVGELIADAILQGCRKFIIGIGGSATNDGGVGMLQALGFDFLDGNGTPVQLGARGLADIATICTERADPLLRECEFCIACDVKNPLCGETGCSAVYGPQKGATPQMIPEMDAALAQYAALTQAVMPHAAPNHPGAGAAGGMGFAFLSYLGATLRSGVELVIAETGLEDAIRDADLVVTGEGRLDGQSYMGKAPIGVAKLAKQYGKTVVAFSGCVTRDAALCNAHGIDAFFPILRTPCTLSEAMDPANAAQNLQDTALQVFLFWRAVDKGRD